MNFDNRLLLVGAAGLIAGAFVAYVLLGAPFIHVPTPWGTYFNGPQLVAPTKNAAAALPRLHGAVLVRFLAETSEGREVCPNDPSFRDNAQTKLEEVTAPGGPLVVGAPSAGGCYHNTLSNAGSEAKTAILSYLEESIPTN